MRWALTTAHGGRGALVAAATAVTGVASGDHSIAIALITAGGGVSAVIIGPVVTDWVRGRRRPPVNHHDELAREQAALVEHVVDELAALRAENDRLRDELAAKRRRRA